MEKIHQDMIIDILSRLPFESVLECKLVCKTWRTLIYYPSFAHLYLRRNHLLLLDDDDDDLKNQNFPSKVGFISLNMLSQNFTCQLHYLEYDENDCEQSHLKFRRINHPAVNNYTPSLILGPPISKPHYTTALVGSCNGLICLSVPNQEMDDPLYICNPITREYVNLPIFSSERGFFGRLVFGFGYSPKANEYKVVRIYYGDEHPSAVGQVQVYTLGDGIGWRNKEAIIYSLYPNSNLSPCICADGYLYWGGVENKFEILAFDIANEEFTSFPLPPISLAAFNYFQFQVLGGSLCFILHKNDSTDIWSFKSQSWSRDCAIEFYEKSLIPESFDPIAGTKRGEFLFWYHTRTVISYDSKAARFKVLANYGIRFDIFETIPHVNSFVSLKALGEEDVMVIN